MTAVQHFYEKLIHYLEQGKCTVGVFCDLSKAFDCVDINLRLLLAKLHQPRRRSKIGAFLFTVNKYGGTAG